MGTNTALRRVAQACAAWETAVLVEPVDLVRCRTGLLLMPTDAAPRFSYVSVASPIEQVIDLGAELVDASGRTLELNELEGRLLDGEVATVVTSGQHTPRDTVRALSDELIARRAALRRSNVLARFLLRQIGLEEVSSHRGAPAQLYTNISTLWSPELSLCIDPAMMLTLGADRQRYVDSNYTERAKDRLPRALGRLHDLAVRSYPRLVIV